MCTSLWEKYQTCNTTSLKKKHHKFDYLLWTCVDFMAYAHGNGHIHGNIHDNMPQFGTSSGVTIVDNVAQEFRIIQ